MPEQTSDTKSEPVIISDNVSNISSTPSVEISNNSEPDLDEKLLSADLSVSDSDEEIDTHDIPTDIPTTNTKTDHSSCDQDSTSENITLVQYQTGN